MFKSEENDRNIRSSSIDEEEMERLQGILMKTLGGSHDSNDGLIMDDTDKSPIHENNPEFSQEKDEEIDDNGDEFSERKFIPTRLKHLQQIMVHRTDIIIFEVFAMKKEANLTLTSLRSLLQHIYEVIKVIENHSSHSDTPDDTNSIPQLHSLTHISPHTHSTPTSTSMAKEYLEYDTIYSQDTKNRRGAERKSSLSPSLPSPSNNRKSRRKHSINIRRESGIAAETFNITMNNGSSRTSSVNISPKYSSMRMNSIELPKSRLTSASSGLSNQMEDEFAIEPEIVVDFKLLPNSLRFRDIRSLDFEYNEYMEPTIIIRRHVVVLLLDPIRAIIMHDRLILIVPPGADTLLSSLENHIADWTDNYLSDKNSKTRPAFESYAYETLLNLLLSIQEQNFTKISCHIEDDLKYFKLGSLYPSDEQENFRNKINSLQKVISIIAAQRDFLIELMDDDESMALLNLSLLREHNHFYKIPMDPRMLQTHEEIEDLFEVYLPDFNSLYSKLTSLLYKMNNSQDMISLKLNTSQNELILAQWSLSVLVCSIGFSTYITGAFGMNLDQTSSYTTDIQDDYYSTTNRRLFIVIFVVTSCMIVIALYTLRW